MFNKSSRELESARFWSLHRASLSPKCMMGTITENRIQSKYIIIRRTWVTHLSSLCNNPSHSLCFKWRIKSFLSVQHFCCVWSFSPQFIKLDSLKEHFSASGCFCTASLRVSCRPEGSRGVSQAKHFLYWGTVSADVCEPLDSLCCS